MKPFKNWKIWLNSSWTALTLLKNKSKMNNTDIKRLLKVSKKTALPILDHTALIKGGYAISDNLEVRLKIKTNFKGEGVIDLLPLSKMKSIESAEIRDGFLFVKNGTATSKFSLAGKIDEFPMEPECKEKIGKLVANDVDTIQNASQFVGVDELRPSMTGVYLDTDNIVATNAHLLRWMPKKSNIGGIILPGKYTQFFNKVDYEAFCDEKQQRIKLVSPNETLIIRTIDANYPQWKNVIPQENDIKLTVETKLFINALNNALPSSNSETNAVFLIIKGIEMKIIARDVDLGSNYEETVPLESKSGSDISIGFNAKFLLSMLDKSLKDTELLMSKPNRAAIMNSNSLIMPVMIEYEEETVNTTKPVETTTETEEKQPIEEPQNNGENLEDSTSNNEIVESEQPSYEEQNHQEVVSSELSNETEEVEIITLIENVTEKSFGIIGITEIIPEDFLLKFGCKCKLNHNGKRQDGYIFSKKRREQFDELMQVNGLMFTLKIAC